MSKKDCYYYSLEIHNILIVLKNFKIVKSDVAFKGEIIRNQMIIKKNSVLDDTAVCL